MNRIPSLIAPAAVALALALGTAASAAMSSQDAHFVTKAAQGGMAEVRLADLALRTTSTPAVRSFADHMRRDHTQNNAQLKAIARAGGYALPSGVGEKNMSLMSELQAEHGAAFDERYLHSQLPAHEQMLSLFRMEAADGRDPSLVAFAKQTIPVIEHHIALDRRDIAALGGRPMSMVTGR